MEEVKFHRHLGVYGICKRYEKILVIHKSRGPYSGRFDLPGGSIEQNETILSTIIREFQEETGLEIQIIKNIGVRDFIVPWTRPGHDHTHCHHVALFYEVKYISGDITNSPMIDDSRGAAWKGLNEINEDNSSPLVLATKEWIESNNFNIDTKEYKDWINKS
ncbi:NUDIX hydrolase [Paenibacillus amylolyticus]|uniref:NUDIX hydrolase n=1 Tax=Paenibacillus amylolyticus TaxID=1451 RepID=UPI00201DA228|nr:NUDIX hydrolase [Paenibacillus amylolyticus]MCL6659267.1 NUDIX hydrolase [Paenibacillus amylolyticus]